MLSYTSNSLKKIVEVYKGFDNLREVVDVGGGIGTMSSLIYSKYPHIKCINYDLPHVIEEAPLFPGVKQVAGEMFVSVPKADTVFMKSVLPNWDDEDCVKALKNSYEALPEKGMAIVVEIVYSDGQEGMAEEDVLMMVMLSGGKERTLAEFEDLAKRAGFCSVKLVCSIGNYSVMEFYKVECS
ncbi:hypothetical protein ACHQM5_030090 [Ranunculus cassubicifolius]